MATETTIQTRKAWWYKVDGMTKVPDLEDEERKQGVNNRAGCERVVS